MIVLDTDILSLMEWEVSSACQSLREEFARHPASEIHANIVSFTEQMYGWMSLITRKNKMAEQIEAYRRLRRQIKLYCNLPIADFDESAATRYQSLRKQFRRLGTSDLKIAAIALVNDATFDQQESSRYSADSRSASRRLD
jgi:tRNA(fMet)-specific endonuclease VapC